MAQNFFSFSLHERTQDAFVAWLCSCYNEPTTSYLHDVAKEFIEKLLGVKVNFERVIVETQVYNIDILLTLKNVNNTGNDYYVVIEDKTNSKIHNNQLVNYIGNLIIEKGTREEHIYVVYYKTGHVTRTPDCIKLNPITRQYYFDPKVKSEYDEVRSVKDTYSQLAGLEIRELEHIYKFFCHNPLRRGWFIDIYDFFCHNPLRRGLFILDEYAKHIDDEYQQYNFGYIDAKGGRVNSQWERIFDESITRNKTESPNKYQNLLFKLAFTGSYWEIYVTKKPTGSGSKTSSTAPIPCTDPILNVRSTIFEGISPKIYPKIYFMNFRGPGTVPPLKMHAKTATYSIPTYNPTFYHGKLISSNYQQPMISRKHIDDLLDAICEEYERVCNSGYGVAFSLL